MEGVTPTIGPPRGAPSLTVPREHVGLLNVLAIKTYSEQPVLVHMLSRQAYPTGVDARPPRIVRRRDASCGDTLGMVDVADLLDDAERRGLCSPAAVERLKTVAGRGGPFADRHARTALVGLLGQAAMGRRREGFQCEALEAGTWRADLRIRFAPLLDEEPYIDLGEGWRSVVERLLSDVTTAFGRTALRVHLRRGRGLHVSFSGETVLRHGNLLDRIAREALQQSVRTCEVCGRGGFVRDHAGISCDAHAVPREDVGGLSAFEVANALALFFEDAPLGTCSMTRRGRLSLVYAGMWEFEFSAEHGGSLVRARSPDGRQGGIGDWRREIGDAPTALMPIELLAKLDDLLSAWTETRSTAPPVDEEAIRSNLPCERAVRSLSAETSCGQDPLPEFGEKSSNLDRGPNPGERPEV